MNSSAWDGLAQVEKDLMVCAMETWGILPYACSTVDDSGAAIPDSLVAGVVSSLVDRDWVQVRRIEARTNPDGLADARYGAPIAREELAELLADPDTWDEPRDTSWIGEVTLTSTESWKRLQV